MEKGGIQRRGRVWSVPSRSGRSQYRPALPRDGRRPTGTCPDFGEGRREFCKHLLAVEGHEGRLFLAKQEEVPYEDNRDWPAVNAAHCNEKEHILRLAFELCAGIHQPPQARGRCRVPWRDVVFGGLMWVHGGKSSRATTFDFRLCHERGLLSRPLHYTSMLRHLQNPTLTPLLRTLLRESALPFRHIERQFAIDATGFSTSTYARWHDEKWGKERKYRNWLKVHAICGVDTHIVTDCKVIDAGDSTQFPELVENTAVHFRVEEISADGAYASKANAEAADAVGAVPYIPVQDRVTGEDGPEVWRSMVGFFRYREAEFRKHYHRRSNIETVFSMVKRKFSGAVRGEKRVVQENELLMKFILHNLRVCIMAMYELGEEPTFWRETG